ncbi:MAG: SCP2 sterol-binding domain-containing protein [Deltaproteobacteria bacterium]|nr:SCP2 sterol-binding domain-containing protein [Deltaproteobacteria bacterium]
MDLKEHPTVKAYLKSGKRHNNLTKILKSSELKAIAKECGADDTGLVDIQRETMKPYLKDLDWTMPGVKTILVLAWGLNQAQMQSQAHSLADIELKHGWTNANESARAIAAKIRQTGAMALHMPAGFPFETSRWPGGVWLTADKIFAVEGGLGHMGINRLVLHPKKGAAVVLGSVLVDRECDVYDQPLDYNPCIDCRLCLSACPVGAVKKDGFDFMACYTHNYRERLGGFQNWIEQIAASRSAADYRSRVSDAETITMWQNLAIGAQTRCDRCMAVCPAGEMAIGSYLEDREGYIAHIVKPFKDKEETIYVVPGSDAHHYVTERFPHKRVKTVSNGTRPSSAQKFLDNLPLFFQPGQAKGLNATYHFTFKGAENLTGTAVIKEQRITVTMGHIGKPDLKVVADSDTWITFLAKEKNLLAALATRKIRIKGSPLLMKKFAACFPS